MNGEVGVVVFNRRTNEFVDFQAQMVEIQKQIQLKDGLKLKVQRTTVQESQLR